MFMMAFTACILAANAQTKEVKREWTMLSQTLDASFVKKNLKFKASASIKMQAPDTTSKAMIGVLIRDKEGKYLTVTYNEQPKTATWENYYVEGEIPAGAHDIQLALYCEKDGRYYFDTVVLQIEDDGGVLRAATLSNPDFEQPTTANQVPGWKEGFAQFTERVVGFSLTSVSDHTSGSRALLVEGKGVRRDSTYLIGTAPGFTPQISALVGMLNNMTDRVERDVLALNLKESDHLMDEKANSVAALIMHLAAAEAYYQVYTFERRGFNEEEKKKWQVAMDLGEEARKSIKGHDINYYLEIYREVRKKTLEEFRKRDDAWLYELLLNSTDTNNYWAWFHMVEHQSSHLGQIRMVKKRLPKREEKLLPVKLETDH